MWRVCARPGITHEVVSFSPKRASLSCDIVILGSPEGAAYSDWGPTGYQLSSALHWTPSALSSLSRGMRVEKCHALYQSPLSLSGKTENHRAHRKCHLSGIQVALCRALLCVKETRVGPGQQYVHRPARVGTVDACWAKEPDISGMPSLAHLCTCNLVEAGGGEGWR